MALMMVSPSENYECVIKCDQMKLFSETKWWMYFKVWSNHIIKWVQMKNVFKSNVITTCDQIYNKVWSKLIIKCDQMLY